MKNIFILGLALSLPAISTADTVVSVSREHAVPVNRMVLGTNHISYPNLRNRITNGVSEHHDTGFGVWDPAKNRSVPEMAAYMKSAGAVVQRFPGGCGAHYFDWKKMVGTPETRPNQKFGIPEFLKLCEETGAVPIIPLPDYTSNAKEAAELVEYLNSPDDGKHPWAAKRTADGRREPWNVIYFECGNETYHGNHRKGKESRGIAAKAYALRYKDFRKAMRAVDPKIRLGAVWHDEEWNTTLIRSNPEGVDFIAPHIYIGGYGNNDGNPAPEQLFTIMFGGVREVGRKLQIFRRQIKESGGKPMPIAVTELNSHFTQEKPVPYRLTLGSALIYADILRQLLYAPDVLMGNYWQFSNEYWGMIKGHKPPYVERPAYHVARLFNSYLLDELLVPQVKTPVFDSPGGYGVPRANSQKAAKESGNSTNLLKPQRWKVIDTKEFRHIEHSDGTLEVIFDTDANLNYYHASKMIQGVYPLYGYRLTGEVRVEGMAGSSGAALQLGDGRGFNLTRSASCSGGTLSSEWKKLETIYTPLVDTTSLVIQLRRMNGTGKGRMFFRNLKVEQTVPENLGPSPLVEVTASRSKDGRKIGLLILNKSIKKSEKVTIKIPGAKVVNAETLTAKSVISTNEQNPREVYPRPLEVKNCGREITIQAAPHSLSALMLEL